MKTISDLVGHRLAPQQKHLWTVDEHAKRQFLSGWVNLSGEIDVDRLKAAAAAVVGHYEILRARFYQPTGATVPYMVIESEAAPAWHNSRALFSADPDSGPVLQLALEKVSDGVHRLHLRAPFLLVDAASLENILVALFSFYGEQPPSEPLQYPDYSEWQNQTIENEQDPSRVKAKEYWWGRGGVPLAKIPFERPDPGSPLEPQSSYVAADVPAELLRQVERAVAGKTGVVRNLLLAAWQSVLARLTGQTEIAVGVSFAGRTYAEFEEAAGRFEKVFPITASIESGVRFSEIFQETAAAVTSVSEWQDFLSESEVGAPPLAGFHFYQPRMHQPTSGISISPLSVEQAPGYFRLLLSLEWGETAGTLRLHYDRNTIAVADVERIVAYYFRFLEQVAAQPDLPISLVVLIDQTERHQVLEQFNDTAAQFPEVCLHHLFERQVERTPDRPALIFEGRRLTYAELNRRANKLAHRLRDCGVGPNVFVGLCTERSIEMVVGVLGILKAGGAYLPLQPDLPEQRLRHLIQESAMPALLTQSMFVAQLPEFAGAVIAIDTAQPLLDQKPDTNPETGVEPQDAVYAIYTSGSTGLPKGVVVEHRNLSNYAQSLCQKLSLNPEQGLNFATVSTLSADLGNTCIYPALISGGSLQVISRAASLDGTLFAQRAADGPMDVLKITPSHLLTLLESHPAEGILPRSWLVLGGDAASWDLVKRVQAASSCRILNHYGPTETTVGSLTYPLVDDDPDTSLAAVVPIGRPIANTEAYVLDESGQPVPVGVAGELYISGTGVARGYLQQPEQTAARFLSNPFRAGRRMYRTGDRARFLPQGDIEFLGRLDNQVKIRGFRVELGEIESALTRHPLVRQAIVRYSAEEGAENGLTAYVLAPGLIESSALRELLRANLPDYMVPARIACLETLPLTANGKVDFAALRNLIAQDPDAQLDRTPPRNATDQTLLGVWQDVLGRHDIGIHDDFFDLGGHSLLATLVISRTRAALNIDVPPSTLFEAPTIAGMSDLIGNMQLEYENDVTEQLLRELEGHSLEDIHNLLNE